MNEQFLVAAVITPLMLVATAGFVFWFTARQDRRDDGASR